MPHEQLEFPWADDDKIQAEWEAEETAAEKAEAELEAEATAQD